MQGCRFEADLNGCLLTLNMIVRMGVIKDEYGTAWAVSWVLLSGVWLMVWCLAPANEQRTFWFCSGTGLECCGDGLLHVRVVALGLWGMNVQLRFLIKILISDYHDTSDSGNRMTMKCDY